MHIGHPSVPTTIATEEPSKGRTDVKTDDILDLPTTITTKSPLKEQNQDDHSEIQKLMISPQGINKEISVSTLDTSQAEDFCDNLETSKLKDDNVGEVLGSTVSSTSAGNIGQVVVGAEIPSSLGQPNQLRNNVTAHDQNQQTKDTFKYDSNEPSPLIEYAQQIVDTEKIPLSISDSKPTVFDVKTTNLFRRSNVFETSENNKKQ